MRTGLIQRAAQPWGEMANDLERWHEYSAPLEGRVSSMYVDIKGLVTCGVGNLIDPIRMALELPWKIDNGAGRLATAAEVREAWNDIKANRDTLKKLHWKYAAKRNDLRLTNDDIDLLVESKLAEFESYMTKHHFPGFVDFPADAQLALCSIAWACGPDFPSTFTNLKHFVNRREWLLAKACCKIRETDNPGVVPRNKNNYLCFDNANAVEHYGLDLEVLYWPETAALQEPPEVELPPTIEPQPELIPLPLPEDFWTSLEDLRKEHNLAQYDRWS